MNTNVYDSTGALTTSSNTIIGGGGGGGIPTTAMLRSVVYCGGNGVVSLAAGGTQDTYIYSTYVGGSNGNVGFVWMPDAAGSIVGCSLTNSGSNNTGQNNVQFMKNGVALGALQVLGPVTSQNSVGASFPKGGLPFVKGDAIRTILGNNTAGSFYCEFYMTVEMVST